MFFVATAPLAADGHVNVSPRGTAGAEDRPAARAGQRAVPGDDGLAAAYAVRRNSTSIDGLLALSDRGN